MSIVVVGGDYLGGIEKNLYAIGVTDLVHISGRKPLDKKMMKAYKNTAFVLVMTNFINHGAVKNVKAFAKTNSIPTIFSKRSWVAIEEKLKEHNLI